MELPKLTQELVRDGDWERPRWIGARVQFARANGRRIGVSALNCFVS